MSSDESIDDPHDILKPIVPTLVMDHWWDDRERARKRARRELKERDTKFYMDDISFDGDVDLTALQYDVEYMKADAGMMARMIKSLTDEVATLRAQVEELQRRNQ